MSHTHLDLDVKAENGRLKTLRLVDFNGHFWFGRFEYEFDETGEEYDFIMHHSELLNAPD